MYAYHKPTNLNLVTEWVEHKIPVQKVESSNLGLVKPMADTIWYLSLPMPNINKKGQGLAIFESE